jgi:hypothetical protein
MRLRDVKLATLRQTEDGIGYIQLSGSRGHCREMRQNHLALQRASEDASGGEHSLGSGSGYEEAILVVS